METTQPIPTRIALAMYIGYECSECGHTFDSVEDLENKDPVCSGKDEKGIKLACRKCFKN